MHFARASSLLRAIFVVVYEGFNVIKMFNITAMTVILLNQPEIYRYSVTVASWLLALIWLASTGKDCLTCQDAVEAINVAAENERF